MSSQVFKKTTFIENKKSVVDPNKAKRTLTQGATGAGKSNLNERIAQELTDKGWFGFDMWAAPNMENCFWAVNLNCEQAYLKKIRDDPSKKGMLHCKCNKSYPIMILCPDTIKFDQHTVDNYNGFIIKSKEFWIEQCQKNHRLSLEFNKNMIGQKFEASHKPLIKIKYIPEPTHNGSNHFTFKKIFTEGVLESRAEGRILVFNPMLWLNEFAKFKAVDIMVRSLEGIKYEYFVSRPEEELAPIKTKIDAGKKLNIDELRILNFDKMWVLAREFGELTASQLKGETNSTLSKKAFLTFIRRSRHANITLIADFQNPSDVFPSIRDQAEVFLLKRAPRRLFGEGWDWLFKDIEAKREYVINKNNRTKYAFDLADSLYPRIEQLATNYAYVVFPDDDYVLWQTKSPDFHHKLAHEHFGKITGITWQSIKQNAKSIETGNSVEESPKQVRDAVSLSMVQLIKSMVDPIPLGKGYIYAKAYDEIMKMAEEQKISRPSWSNWNSMAKFYKRNTKSLEAQAA